MVFTSFLHEKKKDFRLHWGSPKVMFKKISQNFVKSSLTFCLISQTLAHSLWHVWMYLMTQSSRRPLWLNWMHIPLVIRRLWVRPPSGRQHSFVEIDLEIFSTVILSLLLIQEGQLSVSGKRMCTILVNRLED